MTNSHHISVDKKRFPDVVKILDNPHQMFYDDEGKRATRAWIVCQAVREWYKNHYNKSQSSNSLVERVTGYDPEEDFDRDRDELIFESLAPKLTDPVGKFSIKHNPNLWRYMPKELDGHSERVAYEIIDSRAKAKQQFKAPWDSEERVRLIKAEIFDSFQKEGRQFANEEERWTAMSKIYAQRMREEHREYEAYLQEEFTKQQQQEEKKTAKQRRQERIAQVKEELRRLTREEEYEKQSDKEEKQQQDFKVSHEISQS